MRNNGGETLLWKAGDIAPAGSYQRVDDALHRRIVLQYEGPLPASFDGHIAIYRELVNYNAVTKNLAQSQTSVPAC